MSDDNSTGATARLTRLLVQTATAHDEYEVGELRGIRDEEWPAWYATYLRQNGLPQLLDEMPGQQSLIAGLESALADADASYLSSKEAQTEKWPAYYARYLLRRASTEAGK